MATRIESLARVVRAHWNRAAKWPSWVHGEVLGTGCFVIVGAICLAGLKSTPIGVASIQVGQHDSSQVAAKVDAQQASIPAASKQQGVTVRAASNAAQMQTQPATSNTIPPAVDFAPPVIPIEPIVIVSDVLQDDAEVTVPEATSCSPAGKQHHRGASAL